MKAKRLKVKGLKRYEEMTDADAMRWASLIEKKGGISLSNYYRPEVAVWHADQSEREFLMKWDGVISNSPSPRCLFTVSDRKMVRPLLQRIKPYLGAFKQKKAEIALEMLKELFLPKPKQSEEKLKDLAERFRSVKE
jgi:hypothetical protein